MLGGFVVTELVYLLYIFEKESSTS